MKCDTQVRAERLSEQLGEGPWVILVGEWGAYLVETVADTAQLWWELAGGTNNGLEKPLGDLQKVPLVFLQVLTLFQPDKTNKVPLSLKLSTLRYCVKKTNKKLLDSYESNNCCNQYSLNCFKYEAKTSISSDYCSYLKEIITATQH